jgi:hypothetical protein
LLSHAGERRAIAFQLIAALEKYEHDLLPLAKGYDPERYANLSRQFEELRLFAASLPELSVPWVAMLISRTEMTFALFKAQQAQKRGGGEQATFLEKHRFAVEELRGSCARLIKR